MRRLSLARWIIGGALAASLLLEGPLAAQQTLDRTRIPPAGTPPVWQVPEWTTSTLGNGAALMVSERHELPLVAFSVTFLGGANQFQTADRQGLAALAAAMMTEGTTTRDGDALSDALQLLGTNLRFGVSAESGSINFVSTTDKFEPTLAILAEVLEHPTFPGASLDRLRAQRLVALTQAKAQPGAMAARVFPRILYGPGHPLGWSPTEETIKAITRDDVVAFHRDYYRPGRALVTVVGDVKATSVKTALDRAFADWPRGGTEPSFEYPPVPTPHPTTIYLVDRPGAAQSVFAIGNPGPPHSTPDYFPLLVMNQILGSPANFASRLNLNIREEKGYSYGVSSTFAFGHGPGPFEAGGAIVSDKSSLALVEFMKELHGIQGSRPVTDDELATAKTSLIQALPSRFASVEGVNNTLASLWSLGLPLDYLQTYASHVSAVTKADLVRVAKQYIDLEHLAIVIVGDRASIQTPLEATHIAPVVVVDLEGNVVPATGGGSTGRR